MGKTIILKSKDMNRYFFNTIILNKMVVLFFIATIFGCTIDDGDDTEIEFTPKLGTANIAIINALTDLEDAEVNTVDIYIDETKVVSEQKFGYTTEGYILYDYPQGTMFRAVYGGEAPVFLSNPVGDIENNITWATAAELLPSDHNAPLQGQLKNNGYYTLVLVGNYYNLGIGDFVLVEDDLSPPPSGNAKIRFLNAGLDNAYLGTPDVDFIINGDVLGTAGYPHEGEFSPFSDFVNVGAFTLSVRIVDHDDASEELLSETIEIQEGGIYTIVLMGDSFSEVDGEHTQLKVFRHN